MKRGSMSYSVASRRRSMLGRTAAGLGTLAVCLASIAPAHAQGTEAPVVNSGDTSWILTSTALVILMTAPGLALFYGGLVGRKNALSTLMHSFFLLALISLQWVLVGYTLSFGTDIRGLVGGLDFLGFSGVGQDPNAGSTIPHVAFAMYQCAFAVITPALITGAFAERIRFGAFVAFSLAWATFVYDPLAHWVWGGGWLMKLGALDFAGGTVVHVSSGVSALVAAYVIGARRGYPSRVSPPHSALLTLVGGALLWFGWFGFNAGSALTSGGLAAMAFATTNTAAAAAAVAWTILEKSLRGHASALGAVTGAVAGLVAITPAAGFVTVPSAIAIGLGASGVCYFGVNVLKKKLGADDALDVFGVHGLGGMYGALATGVFATTTVNPAGADGLVYGNPSLVVKQLVAVLACASVAAAATFVILKAIALVTSLRVTDEDEALGLDLAIHGEAAYHFANFGTEMVASGMAGASDKGTALGDEALAEA
jgi:Amt family ammonium transporter